MIEANLNGKFASIFAPGSEMAPHPHKTHLRVGREFPEQTGVPLPKALWNQYFNRPANSDLAGVAKHPLHLHIQLDNAASHICGQNAVWR